MRPSAPGWYPDPTGRHERRYWSGFRWTRHVGDGLRRSEDPLAAERLPGPAEPDEAEVPAPPPLSPPRSPSPSSELPDGDERRLGSGRSRRQVVVRVLAGTAVVVALVLGAFLVPLADGDDGGGPERAATSDRPPSSDPLEDHLVEFLVYVSGERLDVRKAHCMADASIMALTRQHLLEVGVMEEDNPLEVLTADEVVRVFKAGFDCLQDEDIVMLFAGTWNPERFGGIPDAVAPCLFRGWLAGWGRTRFAEIVGTSLNSETAPPIGEIVTPEENAILVDTTVACQAEYDATTTTTA